MKKVDLSGQTFNYLKVLEKDGVDENRKTTYTCQCLLCGEIVHNKRGTNISNGRTKSCGCLLSHGETVIKHLLTELKIDFQTQYIFEDLPNKRFDFLIKHSGKTWVIEYDGMQHFEYDGNGWNTKAKWEKTIESDRIKNNYCFKNEIQIIRIPAWALEKLTIEMLFPETSKYLLDQKITNNDKQFKAHWKMVHKAK